MRQLDPHRDGDPESTPTSQAQRLRREIDRYRRRSMEIDHPETARVFKMLMTDAQSQLDQLEERTTSIDRRYPTF